MKEKVLDKNEVRRRLNGMRINPDGLEARKYGVSIKYFDSEELKPQKRMDYEAIVELNVTQGNGEISINKTNLFFNQHEPDFINEILAESISKSLYPVKVFYNEKGIAANNINNHEEILNRWQEQKNKILEKYKSADLDDFFNVFEKKLENKQHVAKSMNYDWFWNLFFHPVLINYGDRRSVKNEMYLAVISYQYPLRFTGTQIIEKIPTDYHSFKVEFNSDEIKAPTYFYPKNAEEDLTLWMSLKVHFDSDVYHHFPMHIRAYFEIYSKDWEGKKIISRRIEFTMYQTNSEIYKTKVLSEKSPFITGGLIKLPPNKWGFDNFEQIENDW
ncbi:hypothetical protein [Frigoriflavimonas asaccharolytica]|uniref:Uncharacterized protein n=1 Tax=Frigoriflavimonas asaccharolytica TaxID=2735899 RepID=A0A8J8K878_9FLAO|nr:hypothetical protein [Frigoriflavimonas asaccharolytica]NRS92311.1 hypothetical protein [Frigoriflavimonas asaccharolytica]